VEIPKFAPDGSRKTFIAWISPKTATGSSRVDTPGEMLLDGGSGAMMMSAKFAAEAGVTVRSCEPRLCKGVGTQSFMITRECSTRFRVGKYVNIFNWAVHEIDQDMIVGLPFMRTIRIINEDTINHRIKFVSKSGFTHTWFGAQHKTRSENLPAILFTTPDRVGRGKAEIFSINLREMFESESDMPCQTRMDDQRTVMTGAPKYSPLELAYLSLDIGSLTKPPMAQAPVDPKPEQRVAAFLATLDADTERPGMATLLRKYETTVFAEPGSLDQIPVRPYIDMKITLKPGASVLSRPLRRFSEAENVLIRDKLDDLLESGRIRPSSSQFGANLLFVKKKDGTWRMCVDFRALNAQTVKDRTPLPSHIDLRESVRGCEFLSKFDVREAFHMVRIVEADCEKTAFKSMFGLFEYTVCPFGLSNSPATFMSLMNKIFYDLMGVCVIYYVDDILIYSRTYEQHLIDMEAVMERLKMHSLNVKLSKCVLAMPELEFCGMNISGEGFAIQESQVQAMCEYPAYDDRTTPMKYSQQFLGSVRFFSDFVPWLGELARPLYELTAKSCV
jgi:hypothetical protein